ncbi:MAG: hypothetical protein ABSC19_06030 [Syntrophorhabdales bacterium]
MDYDRELCDERHKDVERRLEKAEKEECDLHGRIDGVIAAVNGKFTRLLYWIMGLLAASVGGTIMIVVMLLTGKGK